MRSRVSKRRYPVLHDYGMGGAWWWVHARSEREVLETFAEVDVVHAPAAIGRAEAWQMEEVDIDAPVMPAGLDGLRTKRDSQRAQPGFGALADRQAVYLRYDDSTRRHEAPKPASKGRHAIDGSEPPIGR